MSINKYTTKAFILKSFESGEHDFVYKIWTRDFGIIFVLAKSIRKINAKLRMTINKNDFINITIVQGKEIWRLTGAVEEENFYNDLDLKDTKENIFLKEKKYFEVKKIITEAIDRFLEQNKAYIFLFDILQDIFNQENKNKILEFSKMKVLIYYLILLFSGYSDFHLLNIENKEELEKLKIENIYTNFILNENEIKKHIIQSLKESML